MDKCVLRGVETFIGECGNTEIVCGVVVDAEWINSAIFFSFSIKNVNEKFFLNYFF
jgi:hypothetical protein